MQDKSKRLQTFEFFLQLCAILYFQPLITSLTTQDLLFNNLNSNTKTALTTNHITEAQSLHFDNIIDENKRCVFFM